MSGGVSKNERLATSCQTTTYSVAVAATAGAYCHLVLLQIGCPFGDTTMPSEVTRVPYMSLPAEARARWSSQTTKYSSAWPATAGADWISVKLQIGMPRESRAF